jgi:hypothetical protein
MFGFPIIFFGHRVPYARAYTEIDIPNINEMVFSFDTQEIKNVYDLNLVTVVVNGRPRKVLTNRVNVYKLLEDLGVVLDSSKKIVTTNERIQDGTVIRVITVGTVVEEQKIDIPFKTEEVSTKDLPYKDTEVIQEGVLGVRTKEVKKTYEDGKLVSEETVSDAITRNPINRIVKVGVLRYSPDDLDVRYGYNCNHWYSVVDNGDYTDQEKQWLKFVMYCESGCNAENDKDSTYKGLFQWNPKYWDIYFGNDNIYDGYAQIENSIWKIRQGVQLYNYWPNCHRRYVATYGEYK